MGKEIIKPTTPRKEPIGKLSVAEKFVRVGLASLAIAVPIFLEGCTKKLSSPPSTPVGISGKAPQFPGTSNDRPLQTPCLVTTDPPERNLTPGKKQTITAEVTSGLEKAQISQIKFGSYNTEIATVNPTVDSNSPYSTEVTALRDGKTAVWGTAFLSDGRICQSSGTTDTDINVSIENSGTIKISKKPEALFNALLITSLQQAELPPGITTRGISAGNLDATMQALKAIGQVNIVIEDDASTPAKGTPNGGIAYNIFPDSSNAKAAADLIIAQGTKSRTFDYLNYPITVITIPTMFGQQVTLVAASVENIAVVALLTSSNQSAAEARSIELIKAAIQHLLTVGR